MGKKNTFGLEEAPKKEVSQREKEWLEEEIDIQFFNLEEPGMMLKFPFGTTKDFKNYTLFHGGKYKLARKVVNHIESCQTPIWKWKPDGTGVIRKELSGSKSRFQCRQIFA